MDTKQGFAISLLVALSMEDAACDDSPDSTGATPTAAAATGSTVNTPGVIANKFCSFSKEGSQD